MTLSPDQLEFAISRYASGDADLSAAERDAVERKLATSADVRALLAAERRLTDALRADAVPEIDHAALARRVAMGVSLQPAPRRAAHGGIFAAPLRLAVAASILVAAGVSVTVLSRGGRGVRETGTAVAPTVQPADPASRPVMVRAIDRTTDEPMATITSVGSGGQPPAPGVAIGPSPDVAGGLNSQYAAHPDTRPARVVVVADKDAALPAPTTAPY